jgi:hypothetical protein
VRYFYYNEYPVGLLKISEQEIRETYYPFWYEEMCRKFGKEAEYTFEHCLEDWIVVNWGWMDDLKNKLKIDAGLKNLPTDLTYDCRMAVSGQGDRAYEWTDKPHRLVFDLCAEIERLVAELGEIKEAAQDYAWERNHDTD